jgi:glutaredoxin
MTQSQTASPEKTKEPIVFYSKSGCLWCNAVRHLLNEHDVAYEERDVRKDPQQRKSLEQQTQQDATPTLRIGDEWLVDTDAKVVAQSLGLPEPAQVKMAA